MTTISLIHLTSISGETVKQANIEKIKSSLKSRKILKKEIIALRNFTNC